MHSVFARLAGAAICVLTVSVSARAAQPLPEPVAHYYDDMGLVARFSLPEERVQLMSGRRDPSAAGPRLQAVDAALKRLAHYKSGRYTMRYQWGQDGRGERWVDLRTVEPFEIQQVEEKDGLLNVRLRTFADSAHDKLELLRAWDRGGDRPPLAALDAARDFREARVEVHTWRKTDGEWVREPANLVLLDAPAVPASEAAASGRTPEARPRAATPEAPGNPGSATAPSGKE